MSGPAAHQQGSASTGEARSATAMRQQSLVDVLRAQRKVIGVAVVLMVACFWTMGPLGKWEAAALTAGGVALALVNHLATELWLGGLLASGEQPTRSRIAASTFLRLAVVAIVAIAIAVAFWPDGVGLLLGLALFRLITLVMTGIPLLKELRKA